MVTQPQPRRTPACATLRLGASATTSGRREETATLPASERSYWSLLVAGSAPLASGPAEAEAKGACGGGGVSWPRREAAGGVARAGNGGPWPRRGTSVDPWRRLLESPIQTEPNWIDPFDVLIQPNQTIKVLSPFSTKLY